jgi:hypothetical protein
LEVCPLTTAGRRSGWPEPWQTPEHVDKGTEAMNDQKVLFSKSPRAEPPDVKLYLLGYRLLVIRKAFGQTRMLIRVEAAPFVNPLSIGSTAFSTANADRLLQRFVILQASK